MPVGDSTLDRPVRAGNREPSPPRARAERPRRASAPRRGPNVAPAERWTSLASGAVALLAGLARGGVPGVLLGGVGAVLAWRGATGSCPLYQALDVDTTRAESPEQATRARGFHVVQAFTIDRPAEELYAYWRKLEHLPRIMRYLHSVTVLDDGRSRWVAHAPELFGARIAWEAETVDDVPNERISWRSVEGSAVQNAGSITFERTPRGTVVRLEVSYVPPAGPIGQLVSTLLGHSAEKHVREDLRDFKRRMEAGELPTVEGQPRGSCGGLGALASN